MSGRGRAKKTKQVDDVVMAAATDGAAPPVEKKTSRKKQFPVVAVITPDGIEGNLMNSGSRRPLIVHFPIQSKEIILNDMPVAYNPHPPTDAVPYDSAADNPFYDTVEEVYAQHAAASSSTMMTKQETDRVTHTPAVADQTLDCSQETIPQPNTVVTATTSSSETKMDYYKLKSTLLVQFKDSSEVKALPETSSSACFWCCHTFTSRPVVLPIRDTGEHLIVSGNFCCPECAIAHLFDIHQDSHTRWEQMALLYRVYGQICGGKIHPAPPRSSLKLFGGPLGIQEYRGLIHSHTVRVDIHLPPMVSILATMDTKPIDFYDASLTKNVSETVKERLQKAEEVLRLRRTKPLKAWESTLDACINLKIKHEPLSV